MLFGKVTYLLFLRTLGTAGSTLPGRKEALYMLQFHALKNHFRNRDRYTSWAQGNVLCLTSSYFEGPLRYTLLQTPTGALRVVVSFSL
jgi:hypothetical protein